MTKAVFWRLAGCLIVGLTNAPHVYGQMIQSETRLVLVDTVVTDKKGDHVRDLTQKDFKVFEDNREQTITTFSHEAGAAPGDDARKHYTLLFFDDSTAGPDLQAYARRAAVKFIESNTGANRLMATAEFGAALTVTQNFTDDADRLKKAVAGARFAASRPAAGGTTLNDYAIRGALGALRSMIQSLAGLPGRKTLIFVSAGYPGTTTTFSEIATSIEAANRANVAIFPIVPALGQPQGLDDASSGGDAPARGGRRGRNGGSSDGIPVDNTPVGVQQVLHTLANGSGGFVISNTGDLGDGLDKVAKEEDGSYILGYTPQKDAAPGACHTLKVKLDKSYTVRSRSGYCEAKTQDVLSGTPTERDLEARMTANATPTATGASMLAPFFYTAANTARVYVALEVPPGTIHFAKDKGKLTATLNVVGIASLPDGTVKGRFSDSVKLEFAEKKEADAFSAKPFHYEKQFKMAPGAYSFKLIYSAQTNQFGRLDTALSIDPWDPGKFALSGVALSRSAHVAASVTDGLDTGVQEDDVPLKAGGVQVTPSGSDRFRKAEKCYFYAEVYEPELARPGVKAADIPAVGVQVELLDAAGNVKKDLGLTRLVLPPLNGNPSVPVALAVTLADPGVGAFKLRVTALDSKGRTAARTIDVQLEN